MNNQPTNNTDFLNERVLEGDYFYSALTCQGYTISKSEYRQKMYIYHVILDTGEAATIPEIIHRANVLNLGMKKIKKTFTAINTNPKRC